MSARSSITLPLEEIALVERLRRRVGEKTNVGVVRRALRLLDEVTDRAALRRGYEQASRATRASLEAELAELDHLSSVGLSSEGIDD